MKVTIAAPLPSPARNTPTQRRTVRVALVQHRWRPDQAQLRAALEGGIEQAARAGADVVFLPELTLTRYPAFEPPVGRADADAEPLLDGPTVTWAAATAQRFGVFLHASLFERAEEHGDDLGYNTAVLVGPDGALVGRTRKLHIPGTQAYGEHRYFRPGPAGDDAFPVHRVAALGLGLAMPTCYDEWFPEVARAYALAGADLVVYPTAIGSEPDFPDFDSQPQWQQVITGHAIANGLFVVVPNRTGDEGGINFYGSSFVVDPYGRVLAQAPRDEEAVLVADLDLDQRRDWLTLFPLLARRRPDTYAPLTRRGEGSG